MRKLFFILLSLFIVNVKICKANYTLIYNTKADNIFYTTNCIEITSTGYEQADSCEDSIVLTINSTTLLNKVYKFVIPNIQNKIKLKLDIDNTKLLINYNCANGYTNQYYATAQATYKQENKSTYDKGCFNYVRYCSDLTKPENCGITNITGTLTDKQIYQQGAKHILLVQDNTLTKENNLTWCESNIYTETDTTTDPHTTVIEQSKCGTVEGGVA